MLLEKDLKKVFHKLIQDDIAQIVLGGFDVTIRVFDHSSKISLSTPVYLGGNFIPGSVRKCIFQKPPFQSESIKTSLNIDEANYQISLQYVGHLEHLNNGKFKDLLEEFGWLADEWRLFLDEHDKNDLVHVRVK